MNEWNDILRVPERCLVNRKITKAFFKRNFELTLTDKNVLDKQIDGINWLASLNPENTNIPSFASEDVVYEEVQILTVTTSQADFDRDHVKIAEVIQKYIPYAILLCVSTAEQMVWSTCNKRGRQNDKTKRIIEKRFFSQIIDMQQQSQTQRDFLNSLSFSALAKTSLQDLYISYTERIFALQAASLNGTFALRTQERTQVDMLLLERLEALEQEVTTLAQKAKKETQLNDQVQLNLLIQNKRREITLLKNKILE